MSMIQSDKQPSLGYFPEAVLWVDREFPGELEKVRIWFRDYKIPDGKPENKFGYNNKVQNKEFTLSVLEETHGFWKKLKSGERANSEELSLV